MKITALALGTAIALAASGLAQAAVNSQLPAHSDAAQAVPATPKTAGIWGFCGPGRYYRHAEFVENYSGGILQGAIYTTAGCYTPA